MFRATVSRPLCSLDDYVSIILASDYHYDSKLTNHPTMMIIVIAMLYHVQCCQS